MFLSKMGSNQSSLANRNNCHARNGRLFSSNQKEKNKKTHVVSVNSGGAYEHLACTNDNSARSSPSDVRSSSCSLKDADRKKSPSVTCFPCFGCVGNNDELNSSGVPIPGQNNDSIALLRVSSKLSLRAVELEDENNSSPEKPEPCADEIPSEENLGDVVKPMSCSVWTGGQKVEHASDMVSSEGFSSEVVVKGNSISREKHIRPDESDSDFNQTGNRGLFVVSKKHLSFPCGLFSHAKSRPIAEGYSNSQLAVIPMQGRLTERGSERAMETDCMSNGTSCEDSGKASESESALLSLEQGRAACKAPIAKIDSLETTSIDSLDSDDLMVDTMAFSCTSFKEFEEKESRDSIYAESADPINGVCNNQKSKVTLHARHGSAKNKAEHRVRPSCSSLSEPKLNKRHSDTFDRNETRNAANDFLSSAGGKVTFRETVDRSQRVRTALTGIPGARERKRLSCPSTGTDLPLLYFDDLTPTSFELRGVNRLSSTIQEMPDLPMPDGDEFVVLDRETHDDLRNDIETCRALLLDLGVLICQDELNNSSYLDSKNNNSMGYFSVKEEVGKNLLQVSEMTEDSPSYERLAMENNELRTKLTSLQMIMVDQQKLITTLENKLAQVCNTRHKTSHDDVIENHSTPMTTSG